MNAVARLFFVLITRRRPRLATLAAILVLIGLLWAPSASAVTRLKRGEPAPPFTLKDLGGEQTRLSDCKGFVAVIVFGELYNEKTLEACAQLNKVLEDKRIRDEGIRSMLVVSQDKTRLQLKADAVDKPVPATVLHDTDRKTFEAYRVAVLPSVVIVDEKGRVVHAFAAFSDSFADVVTDGLLLATGKIDAATFDQRRHPIPVDKDDDALRAQRLAKLAQQLVDRGLLPLAGEKYVEALETDPECVPARLGLGLLELRLRHLAPAEEHLNLVLAKEPDSIDASLGVAFIQTLRGGKELSVAEQRVRDVLVKLPAQPRAHYLMGLIHEKKGEVEKAAASFKRSAELLLEQNQ